jgi:hypothetical protein
MERKRFTWNARHAHDLLRDETVHVPSINDDRPAAHVMETIDKLIELKAIGTPEGYTLALINDDEEDICGLVVNVSANGENWPAASDGWSDINNYLPTDTEVEHAPAAVFDEMVGRCSAAPIAASRSCRRSNWRSPRSTKTPWATRPSTWPTPGSATSAGTRSTPANCAGSTSGVGNAPRRRDSDDQSL